MVESLYETPKVFKEQKFFLHSAKSQKPREVSAKKLLAATLVLGGFGILIGFFQIGKNIQKPFLHFAQKNPAAIAPPEEDYGALAVKLEADTDGDGISDVDELNLYFTSPYLEDSDSDGITDSEEIKNGTDPNCILGDRCFRTASGEAKILEEAPKSQAITSGNQVTPEFLRAFLKENNVEMPLYENLTDEELMAEYRKVANTKGYPQETGNVQDMSPQELRAFLVKNGMSQELVESFTDEEILQAVKEAEK